MFTSVLMRPTGVQYHIDLAQNILNTAMLSDVLRNELYANLVRLTSGSMPYGIQVCIFFLGAFGEIVGKTFFGEVVICVHFCKLTIFFCYRLGS